MRFVKRQAWQSRDVRETLVLDFEIDFQRKDKEQAADDANHDDFVGNYSAVSKEGTRARTVRRAGVYVDENSTTLSQL